jgi:hypothetical protein
MFLAQAFRDKALESDGSSLAGRNPWETCDRKFTVACEEPHHRFGN